MYLPSVTGSENLQCVDIKWSTSSHCQSKARQTLVSQSTDASRSLDRPSDITHFIMKSIVCGMCVCTCAHA